MTLALKKTLLLSSILSFCVPAYAEVIITHNPFNRIAYTQDNENIYFSIEIFDSNLLKGVYPIADFISIHVDKNKNNSIDEYIDVKYTTSNAKLCTVYLINAKTNSTCGQLISKSTLNAYVGKSKHLIKDHSIFEYKIPKTELSFDEISANVVFEIYSAKSKYKNYPQAKKGILSSTINIPFKQILINEKSQTFDNTKNLKLTQSQKEELTPQEEDCLLWRKSNSIAPTPEKNKYIKNNCK